MDSALIPLFKLLWAPMALLLGWLWHRTNQNEKNLTSHIKDTNDTYATKKEVRELLDMQFDRLHEDILEIKQLLKEERQWQNSRDRS